MTTNIVLINSGWYHSCAIKSVDILGHSFGAIGCWGMDNQGAVDIPAAIITHNFVEIGCGSEHTCAVYLKPVKRKHRNKNTNKSENNSG